MELIFTGKTDGGETIEIKYNDHSARWVLTVYDPEWKTRSAAILNREDVVALDQFLREELDQ